MEKPVTNHVEEHNEPCMPIIDSVKASLRSYDDGKREGFRLALEGLPHTFAQYKFAHPGHPENKKLLEEDFGLGQESGWSHYRHALISLIKKELQ